MISPRALISMYFGSISHRFYWTLRARLHFGLEAARLNCATLASGHKPGQPGADGKRNCLRCGELLT